MRLQTWISIPGLMKNERLLYDTGKSEKFGTAFKSYPIEGIKVEESSY